MLLRQSEMPKQLDLSVFSSQSAMVDVFAGKTGLEDPLKNALKTAPGARAQRCDFHICLEVLLIYAL